ALRTKITELQVPQDCHENRTRPLPVQIPQSFGNAPFDLTFPRGEPIRRGETQKSVSPRVGFGKRGLPLLVRRYALYAEVEKDFFAVPATLDQMYAHGFGGQVIFAGMADEQVRHIRPQSCATR